MDSTIGAASRARPAARNVTGLLMLVNVRLLVMRGHRFVNLFDLVGSRFSALGGRVFMSVGMLYRRLFPGLHRRRRTCRGVLAVMFLFLDDFLIVGNISWVGHR